MAITNFSSTLQLLDTEYRRSLEGIEAFAKWLSADTGRHSARTRYCCFVKSRISEHFNNANLCIRTIHSEKEAIHPDDLTDSDEKAIDGAFKGTIAFLRRLILILLPDSIVAQNLVQGTSGVYEERELDNDRARHGQADDPAKGEARKLLFGLTKQLNSSFKLVALYPTCRYTYRLYRWSSIFLSLAIDLEMLLGNLATKSSPNSRIDSTLTQGLLGLSISERN